jgi:hypothetical protein
MGVKCSLTLREEHRLRVCGDWVLRRIFGPKREDGEDYIMRSFILVCFTKYWGDQVKEDEMGGAFIMHGRNKGKVSLCLTEHDSMKT